MTRDQSSILLIDNYDSFVYNLARYLLELGCTTRVVRNDAATVDEVRAMQPAAVVLSPGPCTPAEAGVSVELVRRLAGEIPILGVCLGHQAIAAAFGGRVVRGEPVHGWTSLIEHDGAGLFAGLPNLLTATRYHSLIVEESTLPDALTVTARTAAPAVAEVARLWPNSGGPPCGRRPGYGTIMAIAHRQLPVFGVQFHPESVLTVGGHELLSNFLMIAGVPHVRTAASELAQPVQDALPRFDPHAVRPVFW